jgi:hypothetical protein
MGSKELMFSRSSAHMCTLPYFTKSTSTARATTIRLGMASCAWTLRAISNGRQGKTPILIKGDLYWLMI